MNIRLIVISLAGLCLAAPHAHGQAQLRLKAQETLDAEGKPDTRASLRAVSRFIVESPKAKAIEVHDLVTIIINESSKQSSQQKLDTKTDSGLRGSLKDFPDLSKLLQAELTNGASSPVATVDVSGGDNFKGDAKYERNDRFTDRISAVVIDVKPNGTLVLEARRTVTKDDEVQTVVLSGMCRREDVTNANSVLSSQLADMTLTVSNEGELNQANKPGWITRAFRTVFDF
ncbi:MAG: flagellar basal body L-ring protein FlgH [Phycisphaerales bacterium]